MIAIDERIKLLDEKTCSSISFKKRRSTTASLTCFLKMLPHKPTINNCTPEDVRKFLVWKDNSGKTVVHTLNCSEIGSTGKTTCSCPSRLSAGSVEGLVHRLINIFDDVGRDRHLVNSNPATSSKVKEYIKLVKEEQAKAHVLPKQAKPIFITKLRKICNYIVNQLSRPDLPIRQQYVLHRDQAFFKLQFFAGDRAGDLALTITQEIKSLADGSGLVFQHTFGKTLRGGKGKNNTFVIKRCADTTVCPVRGLEEFVEFTNSRKVDLSNGYLFRPVSDQGKVLEKPLSYSIIYERLHLYLSTLGIYEGETPHSFRSGCAVTMALSGSVESTGEMMRHIGWFNEKSAEYYSRVHTLSDSSLVASKLSNATNISDQIEEQFREKAVFADLKKAF